VAGAADVDAADDVAVVAEAAVVDDEPLDVEGAFARLADEWSPPHPVAMSTNASASARATAV
jgi:hypothetical protein